MDDNKVEFWKYNIRVPLTSEKICKIIFNTLSVDKEPKPEIIQRTLKVDINCLVCEWKSSNPKHLRVSIKSFFENIQLILDTIEQFDK